MDGETRSELLTACRIASAHAEAVDAEACFPVAAIKSLRELGLLGMAAPASMGGRGAALTDIAEACFRLGRQCGSTALIFAMHQIQLGTLLRCRTAGSWLDQFVGDCVANRLLIASSTTDLRPGAPVDLAPPVDVTPGVRVTRAAAVISYFEQADALLLLAAASPNGPGSRFEPTDRLLVVLPEQANTKVIRPWSGLGLRGTCTHTYEMNIAVPERQVLPQPFGSIDSGVMLPLAHSYLAACWTGMAAAAIDAARKTLSGSVAKEVQLLDVVGRYEMLAAAVRSAAEEARAVLELPAGQEVPKPVLRRLTLLKVNAADAALNIALECLKVAGLGGYQSGSDTSVSRQVRDLLSAPIMISNGKVLERNRALADWPLDESLFGVSACPQIAAVGPLPQPAIED